VEIEINSWLADIIKKYRNYQSNHKFYFKRLPEDVVISLDDQLIQTAILNIVDNACKYSPAGSQVKIQIISSEDHVGIDVLDQGIGIDPGHHDAIFKEYFRVNENSPIRGIGLGLAFVKKIVELHHGKIEVSSRIGEGTRMVIWLPISNKNLMMQSGRR
jgi:signal transduction histidine kinase